MREFRLIIERDCEAESPRDNFNLGTLYIQNLKYHIDISDKKSRRQYWEDREDWGEDEKSSPFFLLILLTIYFHLSYYCKRQRGTIPHLQKERKHGAKKVSNEYHA